MTATTARFLYDTLRTTIIVVALALAAYTMAGGFDTPGNVAGSVTHWPYQRSNSTVSSGSAALARMSSIFDQSFEPALCGPRR